MSTAALVPRIEAAAAPVAKPKRPTAPRYQPLVVLLTAAATGIVVDRYRPLPIAAWWSVVALGLACWLGLHRKRKEVAAAASLLLAVAALGAAWHHDRWNLFGADDVGLFARSRAQPVCIEAVALQSPRLAPHPEYNPMRLSQGDEVRFEIEVQAIRDGELWRSASGVAALAVEGRLPELVAGDRFRVFAHLLPPEEALNPGEVDRTALDRGRRLMAHLHVTYPEAITLLDGGRAIRPWTLLESLRLRGRRIFERYLQPRQAALASAVLLGLREQLEPDETQAFQLTGTIHLLVIAGLHLGIVAWLASVIFRRVLPCRWALPATAFFALGYMLLVEAHPPIIRATVLIVAACVAACSGRARGNFNVLALAGLVVLMLNPSDLFNVGPQLSFLCVAGLMALGPRWLGTEPERGPLDVVGSTIQWTWRSILPSWIPVWFLPDPQPLAIERLLMQQRPWFVRMLWVAAKVIRHLTLVSGAIWLLTVPLVMSRFHIFNPVAILLNTLVWLPMVLALASGLGLLLTGMICPPLASAFAACCNGMLWMIDRAVQFGAHLPGGHAWVPGPAEWWLVGFYAALAAYLAFPGLRPPPRWRLAALGAWTAAGVLVPLVAADHHGLRCTFLSVGHGEAVVLELPDGRTVLYDAGRMAAPTACCRSISGYLWSRGLTHIDAVVLSHADSDHYNALPELLERFSVGTVYVSPVMFDEKNAAIHYLEDSIRAARVPIRVLASGDRLPGGPGCWLDVLHPPPHGLPSTSNANSIVISVEYAGRRILLPADLQSPGLDDVLAERPLRCDLLLVPHHGSKSSKPAQLAAWSAPSWAVLSADHRYDTSGVEAIYARRGRVLHTADCGAVVACIDAQGMTVETFIKEPAIAALPPTM